MMLHVGAQTQNAAKIYHPVSQSIMVQSIFYIYAITSIRILQHFKNMNFIFTEDGCELESGIF